MFLMLKLFFLTRQTTSSILLTQMIGRALRGSQFGGTDKAYIVSFIDNWKQVINWGKSDFSGEKNDEKIEYGKHPDLELISIELVRRWAEQVSLRPQGIVTHDPFISLLPVGWYLIEFQTSISESEDNQFRQLLLVFDNELESYHRFIQNLLKLDIQEFAEIDVSFETQLSQLVDWQHKYFYNSEEYLGNALLKNIFHIARHIAQNDGEPPKWFDFEQRKYHDLDAIAQQYIIVDQLSRINENQKLKIEYERTDRYWNVIYPKYERFQEQYNDCATRILNEPSPPPPPPTDLGDENNELQISREIRDAVRKRDSYRCLCCGEDKQSLLQIDHIVSRYYGGSDFTDNLQTLCKICNRVKGTKKIDFRQQITPLDVCPSTFPNLDLPNLLQAQDRHQWEKFIRRSINFFYQCNAVKIVKIANSGTYINPWEIRLYNANNHSWIETYFGKFGELTSQIRQRRQEVGFDSPYRIIVCR